jgi:lactate permease
VGPELPDLIAGLVSLIALIIFVQFWKPKYRPEYHALLVGAPSTGSDEENSRDMTSVSEIKNDTEKNNDVTHEENATSENAGDRQTLEIQKPNFKETLLAWSPWTIIVVVVIM